MTAPDSGELTPAAVRAMLAIKEGKQPQRSEILAIRRARDLGLVIPTGGTAAAPDTWVLTMTGDLVVQAYKIGRSRWGAR
mgnify:FL=1